jgi:hypothetical protein
VGWKRLPSTKKLFITFHICEVALYALGWDTLWCRHTYWQRVKSMMLLWMLWHHILGVYETIFLRKAICKFMRIFSWMLGYSYWLKVFIWMIWGRLWVMFVRQLDYFAFYSKAGHIAPDSLLLSLRCHWRTTPISDCMEDLEN